MNMDNGEYSVRIEGRFIKAQEDAIYAAVDRVMAATSCKCGKWLFYPDEGNDRDDRVYDNLTQTWHALAHCDPVTPKWRRLVDIVRNAQYIPPVGGDVDGWLWDDVLRTIAAIRTGSDFPVSRLTGYLARVVVIAEQGRGDDWVAKPNHRAYNPTFSVYKLLSEFTVHSQPRDYYLNWMNVGTYAATWLDHLTKEGHETV